ncbi:MAG TPA: glycosyltransferase, partial [Myxococcota bacterium]|nr:glycosyltransferase [Myxococcota bacterium]
VIEALACGTPVIAFPGGSVEELVSDGRTGFVVDTVDAAVSAVGRLEEIDRAACRREAERRFSAERMARDYVELYAALSVGETEGQSVSSLLVPEGLLPETSH